MAKKKGMKLIADNKKAFHDYFIEDTYETERFTSTECISALMKKAIFSTKTR